MDFPNLGISHYFWYRINTLHEFKKIVLFCLLYYFLPTCSPLSNNRTLEHGLSYLFNTCGNESRRGTGGSGDKAWEVYEEIIGAWKSSFVLLCGIPALV
jgi:hypothetical protein